MTGYLKVPTKKGQVLFQNRNFFHQTHKSIIRHQTTMGCKAFFHRLEICKRNIVKHEIQSQDDIHLGRCLTSQVCDPG